MSIFAPCCVLLLQTGSEPACTQRIRSLLSQGLDRGSRIKAVLFCSVHCCSKVCLFCSLALSSQNWLHRPAGTTCSALRLFNEDVQNGLLQSHMKVQNPSLTPSHTGHRYRQNLNAPPPIIPRMPSPPWSPMGGWDLSLTPKFLGRPPRKHARKPSAAIPKN